MDQASRKLLDQLTRKYVQGRMKKYYSVPASAHAHDFSRGSLDLVGGTAPLESFDEREILNFAEDVDEEVTHSIPTATVQGSSLSKSKESVIFGSIRQGLEDGRDRQVKGRTRRYTEMKPDLWRNNAVEKFDQDIDALRKKLKVTGGAIDFERFRNDITTRKEMLNQLNVETKNLKSSMKMAKMYKAKAIFKLNDFSTRYHKLIMVNIVLIQRWWRGVRQRVFFKTAVRKDLVKSRKKHKKILDLMHTAILEQEKIMLAKIAAIEEKGYRDPNEEIVENKRREAY